MSTDYNLYVKKDYPEIDKCIYGIDVDSCFNKSIIRLLFQNVSECDCMRDEQGDFHSCKVSRKDFIAIRELLLYDDNIDDFTQENALGQLDEIIDNCSDEDRLILESC